MKNSYKSYGVWVGAGGQGSKKRLGLGESWGTQEGGWDLEEGQSLSGGLGSQRESTVLDVWGLGGELGKGV